MSRRDVQWYGEPANPLGVEYGDLLCGFCVVGFAEVRDRVERGELHRMLPLDAVIAADTHEGTPDLLACDGGCGRNLLSTCAQLDAVRWRPTTPAGWRVVRGL